MTKLHIKVVSKGTPPLHTIVSVGLKESSSSTPPIPNPTQWSQLVI